MQTSTLNSQESTVCCNLAPAILHLTLPEDTATMTANFLSTTSSGQQTNTCQLALSVLLKLSLSTDLQLHLQLPDSTSH